VNFSETKCFMFTQAGMFGFHCGPHQFNGTIVVQ
jgi:plastocyanin